MGQGDGFAGGVAAGGVGEQVGARGFDEGEEVAGLSSVGELAAQAHGDDLGAGGLDGVLQDLGRGVGGGAQEKAAGQCSAAYVPFAWLRGRLGGSVLCSVSPARFAGSSLTCAEHTAAKSLGVGGLNAQAVRLLLGRCYALSASSFMCAVMGQPPSMG